MLIETKIILGGWGVDRNSSCLGGKCISVKGRVMHISHDAWTEKLSSDLTIYF